MVWQKVEVGNISFWHEIKQQTYLKDGKKIWSKRKRMFNKSCI